VPVIQVASELRHSTQGASRDLDAVGSVDGEGVAVVGGGPSGSVDDVVVVVAEQDEVGEVGGSAVFPVDDVVGVAPAGGPVAAGEDAAAVAGDERAALGGSRGAL
jgi:hypothetical protein